MNKLFGLHRGVLLIVPVLGLLAGCGGMTSVPVPPAPATAHMYWTDAGTNTIQRARLDGSHIEDLLPQGLIEPYGIAVAVSGGKIYWTDWEVGIQRANLDGSGVETLVRAARPNGIAVDSAGGKVYWTDYGANRIRRSNLDGSALEDVVVTSLDNPYGIALDVAGGKVYWTDAGTEKIQRANLDGSQVEDLVTIGLNNPRGLALDIAGGKMYWTDRHLGTIQRANLDGSEVEDLVTPATPGVSFARRDGLALDVGAGKMYWTNQTLDRIQRANLDGSDIEDVTDDVGAPYEVALDVAAGKMYWTDLNRGIQRANLDGSGAELLVAMGIYDPRGIAVDGSGGAIYAVDAYPNEAKPNEIRRFNLDGTSGEVLALLGMRGALAIALDVAGGKIYWTDRPQPQRSQVVQRRSQDPARQPGRYWCGRPSDRGRWPGQSAGHRRGRRRAAAVLDRPGHGQHPVRQPRRQRRA